MAGLDLPLPQLMGRLPLVFVTHTDRDSVSIAPLQQSIRESNAVESLLQKITRVAAKANSGHVLRHRPIRLPEVCDAGAMESSEAFFMAIGGA